MIGLMEKYAMPTPFKQPTAVEAARTINKRAMIGSPADKDNQHLSQRDDSQDGGAGRKVS